MKTKLFLVLLISYFGYSQIPSGYYSTATGTGYTLKTQLYNKIKGHTNLGYAGLWTTYSTSDRDKQYENDNSIIDIYSEKPTSADPYVYSYSTSQCGTYATEGDCYNREHIIPQSVFNSASPMVADAHFIPPTDGKVNAMRADYPHGTVATATWTSLNGSKLGTSGVSGYSGTVFEPIDEFKGDVARMYFYFATRYQNTVAGYVYPMFNGTSNQVFTTSFLNLLIQWHNQDPVSAREIARNNAIYTRQGNRNPFIDHPEYVSMIWGGGSSPAPDTQAPTAPTNLTASSITGTSLQLNWSAASDNIGVTAYEVYVNATLRTSGISLTASVTGLTAGTTYSIFVKAKDAAGNSTNSATIQVTTTSTVTVSDLYISEYIEGSSNNKVIEITNATGASVNLSAYSLKRQTNGAGAWSTGLTLSGTLVNGAKFIIVNSSISSSCYATGAANLATAATEMTFNGNDAMGLFKNNVLIDVVGTFNGGTANFAADETLRRNATATVPKSTFNKTTDWTVYATDTCNGIGNRVGMNISSDNLFSLFPNPSNGSFQIESPNQELTFDVAIYSINGQKLIEKFNCNSGFQIDGLQTGIYLVRISSMNEDGVHKICVN